MNPHFFLWLGISLSPMIAGFFIALAGITTVSWQTAVGYIAASSVVMAYGLVNFFRTGMVKDDA